MRSYLKNCANIKNYTRITTPVSKGYHLIQNHVKPYATAQKDNPITGSCILLRYPAQKVLRISLIICSFCPAAYRSCNMTLGGNRDVRQAIQRNLRAPRTNSISSMDFSRLLISAFLSSGIFTGQSSQSAARIAAQVISLSSIRNR